MNKVYHLLSLTTLLTLSSTITMGCGNRTATQQGNTASDVVQVMNTKYDPASQTAVLNVRRVNGQQSTGESTVDLGSTNGLSNYTAKQFPGERPKQVHVVGGNVNKVIALNTPTDGTDMPDVSGAASFSAGGINIPGVRLDPSIQPVAGLNASAQQKANAVLSVAKSKLGTPYIWGHNEDRGQFGFDCSNFTAYVYHHALGYKMSGASQTQYRSVGVRVPKSQMKPGYLVIFDQGGHAGIYAGNGQMIQEGGGLAKVGYLPLAPGKYWYKHITVVKKMF